MMLKKTTCDEKNNTAHQLPQPQFSSAEQGQAMVEYAILLAGVLLGLTAAVGAFLGGIGGYYMNLVKLLVLPFP